MSTLLDETSLAATLWRLEEARLEGRSADEVPVAHALEWVVGRFGQPGAYRARLFAPTERDLAECRPTPTGERRAGRGGTRHILGEEAVRALLLWNRRSGWEPDGTLALVRDEFVIAEEQPGWFCCCLCSAARWRALAAGRPRGWEEAVSDGIRLLAQLPLDGAGRWRRFPFHYTLLALAEMPLAEAQAEGRRVRPAAERALRRLRGDDRAATFRRRGLEWAAAVG